MSFSVLVRTTVATAIVIAVAVSYYAFFPCTSQKKRQRILQKLPRDLDTWRIPGNSHEAEEKIWQDLHEIFRDRGFTLWPHAYYSTLKAPDGTFPLSSGFAYSTPDRGVVKGLGSVKWLCQFQYINPLTRIARTRDGHDVAVRVIVIRNEGEQHLKILRRIATGPYSLLSNNHSLPMLEEFRFEDIIFGIFPKAADTLEYAFDSWPKNSVGDVMDMLMQALEALAFIHGLNIAHRDAFHSNFLVQWHPESMRTMKISVSRPRVYLIDFEVAVEFPDECSAAERVSTGYPLGGSFPQPEMYSRPVPVELTTGEPYNPFKLDIWQLGISFVRYRTTIAPIDNVLTDLINTNQAFRINAKDALERLGKVVYAMTPESLLIHPEIAPRSLGCP